MLFDEASQCCCTEVVNPLTKIGSRVCNCTQPAVPQNQNCQCRPSAKNASQISCVCSDCNNVRQAERFIPQSKCKCSQQNLRINALNTTTNSSTTNTTRPASGTANSTTNTTRPANGTTNSTTNNTRPANGTTNSTGNTNTTRPVNGTTNSTTNGTISPNNTFLDCSCQVDYAGLCQQIDFSKVSKVDESSCEAANRPKSPVPTLPTSQCNNEYEYIVAVVAANKDSSVLLNLQSYQAQSGYFFGVSALAFMILALTMIF